jgi:peptide/nickel transport system substrate-binding protein
MRLGNRREVDVNAERLDGSVGVRVLSRGRGGALRLSGVTGIAILVLLAGALTASEKSGAASSSNSKNTVVYAISTTPADLDPNSSASFNESEVFTNTLSRLFDFKTLKNADGTYVMQSAGYQPVTGALATSWTVSADKKTILVNLRHGVKNYLGHNFSATDVRYTMDRLLALKGTATDYLHSIGILTPANVVVLSPYKVEFKLAFPAELFFKMMAIPHMGIEDAVAYKQHATSSDPWATAWAHTDAVGWGPYHITQNQPGVQVVLQADPNYWGAKPQIRTVIEKDIPSAANQLALLKGGSVDVVADLDPRQLISLKGDSSIKVASFAPAQTHSDLYMNNDVKPLNNRLVRQAVCYALPYDQIVKSVGLGTASRQKSPLPANYSYYAPQFDPYTYNPTKAKALLAKAGYSKGFTTSIKFSSADDPTLSQQATMVQAALNAVGIKISLIDQPYATYAQDWLGLKYQMGMIVEGAFIPDYTYALPLWYSGPKSSNFLDFTDYNNKTVNGLMAQAEKTFNPATQKRLALTEQKLILNDAPMCYLVNPGVHIASQAKMGGISYYTYSAQAFNLWTKK